MTSLYCPRPYPTPQEPTMATQCDLTLPAGWSR